MSEQGATSDEMCSSCLGSDQRGHDMDCNRSRRPAATPRERIGAWCGAEDYRYFRQRDFGDNGPERWAIMLCHPRKLDVVGYGPTWDAAALAALEKAGK